MFRKIVHIYFYKMGDQGSYYLKVIILLISLEHSLPFSAGEKISFHQILMKDILEVVNSKGVHLPDSTTSIDNFMEYSGKLNCFGSVIDLIGDITYGTSDIDRRNSLVIYSFNIPVMKLHSKFSISINSALKKGTITGTLRSDLNDLKMIVSSKFVNVKNDCEMRRPETKVILTENRFSYKLENLQTSLILRTTIDTIINNTDIIISKLMSQRNSTLFKTLEGTISENIASVLEHDIWDKSLSQISPCDEILRESTASDFRQYKVPNFNTVTWYQAFISCLKMGGNLATFNNRDEYDRLVASIPQSRSSIGYWIAGRNLMDSEYFDFVWFTNGNPLAFTVWDQGEPNHLGHSENCVELRSDRNFRMNNVKCLEKRLHICEFI